MTTSIKDSSPTPRKAAKKGITLYDKLVAGGSRVLLLLFEEAARNLCIDTNVESRVAENVAAGQPACAGARLTVFLTRIARQEELQELHF